jgi:hypothetical protein
MLQRMSVPVPSLFARTRSAVGNEKDDDPKGQIRPAAHGADFSWSVDLTQVSICKPHMLVAVQCKKSLFEGWVVEK